MTDSDGQGGAKDRLFTELICLLRGERASNFWTYWLFCNALVKASKGHTQFWVLFYSWLLTTWIFSLRTDWAVFCGPQMSSWPLSQLCLGNWEYLFALMNQKQKPGGASPRSPVHLHQYWMLNIIKLEEGFKEICDLQDPMPDCRANKYFHRTQTMPVT